MTITLLPRALSSGPAVSPPLPSDKKSPSASTPKPIAPAASKSNPISPFPAIPKFSSLAILPTPQTNRASHFMASLKSPSRAAVSPPKSSPRAWPAKLLPRASITSTKAKWPSSDAPPPSPTSSAFTSPASPPGLSGSSSTSSTSSNSKAVSSSSSSGASSTSPSAAAPASSQAPPSPIHSTNLPPSTPTATPPNPLL